MIAERNKIRERLAYDRNHPSVSQVASSWSNDAAVSQSPHPDYIQAGYTGMRIPPVPDSRRIQGQVSLNATMAGEAAATVKVGDYRPNHYLRQLGR